MVSALRRALWLAGVPLAALLGGLAGWAPVFVMGLSAPMFLVGPLSLLSGACLATLCAGWLANIASWGESRSRFLAASGFSLVGAILALPFYWVAVWLVNVLDAPLFLVMDVAVYLSGAVVFVAVTSLAVWRLRLQTQRGLALDLGLTLLMLVATPALVFGTINFGCRLASCVA